MGLTVVGLPILIVGILYMQTIGKKLIPDYGSADTYTDEFNIQPYLTEVEILPHSTLVGKSLAESGFGKNLDVTIIRVVRDDESLLVPSADLVLESGDVLLVEGGRDNLLKIEKRPGVQHQPRRKIKDSEMQSEEIGLFEVVLLPNSKMIGRTIQDLKFRERYNLQVLGINRNGEQIHEKLSQIRLGTGDELLLQGDRNMLLMLHRENALRVIRPVRWRAFRNQQAVIAIVLFFLPLILAALNLLSLGVAVLAAAFLAFITRVITPEEAYRSVEWRILIMIGSMLAIGEAMQVSGTAEYLANLIVKNTAQLDPIFLLVGFFVLSLLLTQPMSNQAAAVVVVPVAIQLALQLGLNPRTFAVMIAIGASSSFLTPLEPATMLVYGPGGYKFSDFPKVGLILTLFILVISVALVPIFWPLK